MKKKIDKTIGHSSLADIHVNLRIFLLMIGRFQLTQTLSSYPSLKLWILKRRGKNILRRTFLSRWERIKLRVFSYPVLIFSLFFFMIIMLASCGNDYYPKPRGYMRIALPEREYVKFDTTYPFTFEYPVYSKFVPDTDANAEPYWFNLDFPQFKGELNVSYKPVNNNIVKYLEDTRTLVMKHIPKATSIDSKQFVDEKNHIYGLTYTISGTEAASPFQFYLTDSTKNFVRGALYFNTIPNNDSLAPVIDFLKQDIVHLIETFRWKETP